MVCSKVKHHYMSYTQSEHLVRLHPTAVCMYVRTCVCMRTCVCVRACMCVHACVRARVCVCILSHQSELGSMVHQRLRLRAQHEVYGHGGVHVHRVAVQRVIDQLVTRFRLQRNGGESFVNKYVRGHRHLDDCNQPDEIRAESGQCIQPTLDGRTPPCREARPSPFALTRSAAIHGGRRASSPGADRLLLSSSGSSSTILIRRKSVVAVLAAKRPRLFPPLPLLRTSAKPTSKSAGESLHFRHAFRPKAGRSSIRFSSRCPSTFE